MSLDSGCQLYVWAGQERRSCEAEVVTSIKLPGYTTLCLGVGGGVALQPRAYTTCPGFRVYRDTRSRGVNLQFSVKCALKAEFDNWSLSVHCWIHQTMCFDS